MIMKKWWRQILIGLMIALGIGLKFFDLSSRPIHHDESLHGAYARYMTKSPDNPNYRASYYQYNPMLHGPLMYHVQAKVYQFFQVSKWSTRILPAFVCSLILLVLAFIVRKQSTITQILVMGIAAFSPSMVYFSRFLRHDQLTWILILLFFWATSWANGRKKAFLLPFCVVMLFTNMENAFIYLFLLVFYLVLEFFYQHYLHLKSRPLVMDLLQLIRQEKIFFFAGFVSGALIFVYLYSGGYQFPHLVIDGLYRQSLLYWLHQHNISRIDGPFAFQTLILAWYDYAFLAILGNYLGIFYWQLPRRWLHPFLGVMGVISLCYLAFAFRILSIEQMPDFLKLRIPLDVLCMGLMFTHGAMSTFFYFHYRPSLAPYNFLFWASFFIYSFVGEKVPWLAQYILLAGLLLITKLNLPFRPVLVAILLVSQIPLTVYLNYQHRKNEVIIQVHTTPEFEKAINQIRPQQRVLVEGNSVWPAHWYLHGRPNYTNTPDSEKRYPFDVIFTDNEIALSTTYPIKQSLPLRSWWLPDYHNFDLGDFFNFLLFRHPWNPPGAQNIMYYSK